MKWKLIFDKNLWEDDKLQFARLLCEIQATQSKLNIKKLSEAMDLDKENIAELFERANNVFENSKLAHRPD